MGSLEQVQNSLNLLDHVKVLLQQVLSWRETRVETGLGKTMQSVVESKKSE